MWFIEKKACELEFSHDFLINLTHKKCKVTFFIKHFLISLILYERGLIDVAKGMAI